MIETVGSGWMWGGFVVFVLAMLAVDMFALGGKGVHRVSVREALGWSAVWVALALAFNAVLWWYLDQNMGREVANTKALEFLSGYLIEKSLSVDNIFVFLMVFSYFAVPAEYQRRVLLYGVIGALVMRAVMILLGVWLVTQFSWVLYLFGVFLLITGVKMLIFADHEPDLDKNPILRWLRGHLRITEGYEGERFFTVRNGVRYVTPLFLVLVLIEATDLVFAVDSIPAIFAITTDPFLVFTSNIFAILGLRSLYFVLASLLDKFSYLKYSLIFILFFLGVKILISHWVHLPAAISLGIIALALASGIVFSLLKASQSEEQAGS